MARTKPVDAYILSLGKTGASLLLQHNKVVTEIHDGTFPLSFQDDYEYSRASRGTSFGYSLKGYEKDKSIVKKERFNKFLRSVNKKLKGYLKEGNQLLLAGTKKIRDDFKKVSDFNPLISLEISGSYRSGKLSVLKKEVNKIMQGE